MTVFIIEYYDGSTTVWFPKDPAFLPWLCKNVYRIEYIREAQLLGSPEYATTYEDEDEE